MATEEPLRPECDEVTESLEMLDAVLLQFDEEKQTPPPPEEAARIISSLVGSPYQSLQRGQGTQTTFPRPNKKLSSQFGSLPFDLSAHAAPSAPPWLNKETARNHLHLPIKNPLTTSVGHSSEEEQFSDDSLEGQVWSSDRDLSNDREDAASRGDIVSEEGEKENKDDGRISIAWSIDWNDRKMEEPDINGKGTYVIKDKKRRLCLEDGLFERPQIPSSKSSDHLHKSAKNISRGRSLPSLSIIKPRENGIIVAINQDADEKIDRRVNGYKEPIVKAGENSLDACDSLSADANDELIISPQQICEKEPLIENSAIADISEKDVVEAVNVAINVTENQNNSHEDEKIAESTQAEDHIEAVQEAKIEVEEICADEQEPMDVVEEKSTAVVEPQENPVLVLELEDVPKENAEEEAPEKQDGEVFAPEKPEEEERVSEKLETEEKAEKLQEEENLPLKLEEEKVAQEKLPEEENLPLKLEEEKEAQEKLPEKEILPLRVEEAPVTLETEEIALETPEIDVADSIKEEEKVELETVQKLHVETEATKEEPIAEEIGCNNLKDEMEVAIALETEEKSIAAVDVEEVAVKAAVEEIAQKEDVVDNAASLLAKEVEPELLENHIGENHATPLSENLDSGSEVSEEETTEPPGPCEMSFKIMRPKVIPRPNSMPATEENVVVYTNSVTLYPDAGLITYYDQRPKNKKEAALEGPNLLRPKSCSDITAAAFTCVDISLDEEPLSLEPITITATEDASETIDAEDENVDDETEELDEEVKEEMKERVMELPIKVDCLVQTDISGLSKRLCLESPGEQVVPSMAGFTPVENKSLELSLLSAKKDADDLPAIEKPTFLEPIHRRDIKRPHLGSHTDINIPAHRHSVPESFLFPGSFTIPLSFAVINKPSPSPGTDVAEEVSIIREKRKELPPPPLPEHQNVPKYIENRPRQKTPTEPEYRSVHKNRPPVPPHRNLTELYSEPRTFPEAFPTPPPPPLAPSYSDQKPPVVPEHKAPAVPEHKAPAIPEHKAPPVPDFIAPESSKAPAIPEHRVSYPEQPLPPTPLTPDRPLPPSPRLPTSASFPVPPVARHSPNIPHRPLPSPPNTLKTRSVDAGLGKGLRDQLKAQQGCTLPPDLGGATPRRGGLPTGRKKHRAPAVPPHASLPETPVFSRGCDIPRAPYRALGIPVLRSSLSEEGAALCGPGRGWYPKQRRPAARSTENLEQAGWGTEGGGGRKPHTLPPNMSPPKFFHRSSPREALRRVTSLLIRGRTTPAAPAKPKERPRETAAAAAACETPQRQKRSFFRHFWKKSKHYSLEQ